MDKSNCLQHDVNAPLTIPAAPRIHCRAPRFNFQTAKRRHCEPTGRANARPMTGSAKQSIKQQERKVDCFVAEFIIGPAEGRTRWLLAMTGIYESAIPRREAPELCMKTF